MFYSSLLSKVSKDISNNKMAINNVYKGLYREIWDF
jgi:hypothetical protein